MRDGGKVMPDHPFDLWLEALGAMLAYAEARGDRIGARALRWSIERVEIEVMKEVARDMAEDRMSSYAVEVQRVSGKSQ